MSGQRCAATTLAGKPCPSWVVRGRDFCVTHEPSLAIERATWNATGGYRRRRSKAALTAISLGTLTEIRAFVETVAADAAALDASPRRCSAMLQAASLAVDILVATELEVRVSELERAAVDGTDGWRS